MIDVNVDGDVKFISFVLEEICGLRESDGRFGVSGIFPEGMGDLEVSGIFPGGLNMNSTDEFDWLT